MPVVEGQVFLQAGLVFGLIGLLGLVLRWTFGRDSGTSSGTSPRGRRRLWRRSRAEPQTAGEARTAGERPATDRKADSAKKPADGAWSRPVAEARPTSPAPARPTAVPATHHEDYGLLAVAADVGTADEAATVRRLLKEAGIRNTNALAPDGRHKVLVFGHELMRARRVAGGGTTGTGGAAGAGGS